MVPLVSAPLAYFITFHTYGTWLPGDPRGSVDAQHRTYGTPYVGSGEEGRFASSARRLIHPPIYLGPEERTVVLRTAQEVCRHRGWELYAVNVQSNHIHIVIRAEHTAERVMHDLKAWSTRRVVEAGLRERGVHMWVRHGSTRMLWQAKAVRAACAYVLEGQGEGRQWVVDGRHGFGSAC
jgi:REP element-mobilizing transposase RayT